VVAKCTNYGVFIDIPDLAMGGMIHISNLSKQFVRFNPSNESLSAGATVYRVGSVVQVQVATVDFNLRRADFMLVGAEVQRTENGRPLKERGLRGDRTQEGQGKRPPEQRKGRGQEGRGRGPTAGGGGRPASEGQGGKTRKPKTGSGGHGKSGGRRSR
jgi:uncharacterized protein